MHVLTPRLHHSLAVLAIALAAIALMGVSACSDDDGDDEPAATTTRVAFVYVGPVGDGGWTYAHNEGRLAAEALLDNVETHYLESVVEATSATEIQQLVDDGYNLIFTTSFGYMDPTEEVALANPDVKFEHCSGYKSADNLTNYFGRIYQPQYLAGVVAGHMTTNNLIGYVAPLPIPEMIRGINAFTMGARSVNPDVEVHVRWSFSWYAPETEAELSNELLQDVGVDLLATAQDSTAPLYAARDAGVYFIGYDTDPLALAADTVLTSTVWDWSVYYVDRIRAVQDGTWATHSYWGGMETGLIKLGLYGDMVSQDMQDEVAVIQASIEDGSFKVFAGPLTNQDGTEWLAAGQELNDGELLSMMQYVEGVVGDIPSE